ncbi:MAG TPA: hypothetical protein DEH78_32550, partial [Solibacterales bacterium]|nr:hypothetical protein [Bryobacterales bacterium]
MAVGTILDEKVSVSSPIDTPGDGPAQASPAPGRIGLEERFRIAAESASDMIYEWNLATGELHLFGLPEKLFGPGSVYDPAAVPKSFEDWKRMLHPEDAGRVLTAMEDHLRNGGQFRVEFRMMHSRGEVRWWENRGKALHDPGGGATRWVGVMTDITDSKRAEAALRESEHRYRQLFDHSLNAVALHEVIVGEDGRPVDYAFLEVNRAFEELTGLSAAQVIGQRVTSVLPEVAREHFIEIFGGVGLSGQPVRFESFTQSLGRHYDIAAFCPRPGYVAVAFTDITERKIAEDKL